MKSDVFGIVGTTVAGIFHVEAVVAEGGFAVVYRAQHAVFRAPVALKCLKIPAHLAGEDQERFERQFQDEAEVLFKLSAGISAVVRPLHIASVVAPNGRFMPFLALEWLDGETLDAAAQKRARRGTPFSLDEVIELLSPIARALESAHHFSGPEGPVTIVHRDVKPENVFIARTMNERVVKILDFGIAKVKTLARQVTTSRIRVPNAQNPEASASFSPAYGAPEQWLPMRFGTTGPWTDVWGLALTMVEVLAGRPVIDGEDDSMLRTVIDPTRRPTPRSMGVAVTDAVEEVFERALTVNPQARFRHAGEFWNALLAARGEAARKDAVRESVAAPVPQHVAAAPRRLARSGGHVIVSAGGAAPVLRQHDIPETAGPYAGSIQLELDDRPLASQTMAAAEPGSGEWARFRAPNHSSAPPAVGRAERSGISIGRSSYPPRLSGTDVRASLPVASGVRVRPAPAAARPARNVGGVDGVDAPGIALDLAALAKVPALLVLVGVALTVANGAYADSSGQVLTLGPVRLAWLAGAAVLSGIGLALYRLWARIA
jgi:serine/threonine-protein kinase